MEEIEDIIRRIYYFMLFGLFFVFVSALIKAIAYLQREFYNFNTINAWSIILKIFGFLIIIYGFLKNALSRELNTNIRIAMLLVAAIIIGFAFGF